IVCHGNIVVPNQGEIVWNAQSQVRRGANSADGEQIVDGNDGCRPGRQLEEFQGCLVAILNGRTAIGDQISIDGNACRRETISIGVQAIFTQFMAPYTINETDTAMPKRQ